MRFLCRLAVLIACCVPGPAFGEGVRDDAQLFRPQTLAEANKVIARIEREHGKRVLVETYPSLCRLRGEGQDLAKKDVRDAVFKQWAEDRCRAENLDGVYVLICKDPKYVLVTVWPESNGNLVEP